MKDRDQVLRRTRRPGGKFQVAIASVERAGGTKRVLGRARINFWDAYPK